MTGAVAACSGESPSGAAGVTDTGAAVDASQDVATESAPVPYYFVVIHVEPYHDMPKDLRDKLYAEAVPTIREMIAKAESYGIKLTIMLHPEWTGHTKDEIAAWKTRGHEVAAHHHGVYHPGTWDGYSGLPPASIDAIRKSSITPPTRPVESYLGDLNLFMTNLSKLSPGVVSGCSNEEMDKREMPSAIVFGTCSGYSNKYSDIGKPLPDWDPSKSVNEFVLSADLAGVPRKWLSHGQLIKADDLTAVTTAFKDAAAPGKRDKTVIGTVNHAAPTEKPYFDQYLEMVHQLDPKGTRSRTLTEVVKSTILPVEEFVMVDNREMKKK